MPPQIEPDDFPHGRAQPWQDPYGHRADSISYALSRPAMPENKLCHTCGAEVPYNAVLSVHAADHMRLLEKATGKSLGMAALVCSDCADLLREALNARTDTMASRLGSQVHHELNALYRVGDPPGPPNPPKPPHHRPVG
jgi:hypothetical protein